MPGIYQTIDLLFLRKHDCCRFVDEFSSRNPHQQIDIASRPKTTTGGGKDELPALYSRNSHGYYKKAWQLCDVNTKVSV